VQLRPALEEAWGAVIATLEALDPHDWTVATPCDPWTVHDVGAHLGHIEGMAHGFPQPEPPDDFDETTHEGLDLVTNAGVAARRAWPHKDVLDELRRASSLTLERLWGTDDEGWRAPTPSPVGTVPLTQAMELRLADVYVHLLDIRQALGRALSPTDEPMAAAGAVGRAMRLTGWAAVKRAGLPDGVRIRLSLDGPSGRDTCDLLVEGGRGHLVDPEGTSSESIAGTGLAYLLAVAGRADMADAAGGLAVIGDGAARLVASYRLFG
jgi:uncharacterized protein (TIGR03083 family)